VDEGGSGGAGRTWSYAEVAAGSRSSLCFQATYLKITKILLFFTSKLCGAVGSQNKRAELAECVPIWAGRTGTPVASVVRLLQSLGSYA
jgi:hypothetical protein